MCRYVKERALDSLLSIIACNTIFNKIDFNYLEDSDVDFLKNFEDKIHSIIEDNSLKIRELDIANNEWIITDKVSDGKEDYDFYDEFIHKYYGFKTFNTTNELSCWVIEINDELKRIILKSDLYNNENDDWVSDDDDWIFDELDEEDKKDLKNGFIRCGKNQMIYVGEN